MTKLRFLVELDKPPQTGVKEVQEYLRDAIEGWGGQLHPDDPLFDVSEYNVRVNRIVDDKP